MMFTFKDLMIEGSGLVVVSFGRFNPPTIGHEKVIEKVSSIAGSAPMRIYPSHTVGSRDPLPHAKKIAYMRKMFPRYKKNIVADKQAKTIINIAVKLYDEGFTDMVMVAGSDRVAEFEKLLNTYNGVEGKRHGYYKFNTLRIINAGQRDPDSEGVEGMSASKMRAAAQASNYKVFKSGIPNTLNDKDCKKLYLDVRKHMGIRESKEMGELTDFESMRDAYLTGQVWKIDDIVEANGHTGKVINRGTNYLSFVDENGNVHKTWLHDIVGVGSMTAPTGQIFALKTEEFDHDAVGGLGEFDHLADWVDMEEKRKEILQNGLLSFLELHNIDERDYKKEYANYQGKPDQIERRSSRNKARRVMGDKVEKGKDVGHKDNNPLNNDPKNLRNEDPSKNRAEPRYREEGKLPPHLSKFFDKKGNMKPDAAKRVQKGRTKRGVKITDKTPKGYGPNEELDELWYNDVVNKMKQITHPKTWSMAAKAYAAGMKDKKHREHPSAWASEIARMHRGIEPRSLIKYINVLVKKGQLPNEMLVDDYDPQPTFKDLVHQIQENGDSK